MEIGKSLTYITEDPRWQQKLLVGTGVFIASMVFSIVVIGVLGFFIITGYAIRLLQNVRDGELHPLPEWDQWGDDLARGFKLFVVSLVWSLPLIIFTIPSGIGNALVSADSEGAQVVGVMLSICGSCLSMLFGLVVAAVTPGFSIAFAEDERISSGLAFRDIIAWTQENIGQVIIVVLVVLVASLVITLVAGIVGVLLCLVGLIVTIPLGGLVTLLFQYHLYGQLAYAYPYGGSGGPGSSTPPAPTTPPESMTSTVASETSSSESSTQSTGRDIQDESSQS